MDPNVRRRQNRPMLRTIDTRVLSMALLAISSPVFAAGEAEVTTAQIAEEGSNIAWGHAIAVIDKPIDDVLPVVLDYDNYVKFMPNFTKSKVLAQRGHRAVVYMEVSLASGTLTLWGQLRLSDSTDENNARLVEARLVDGNMNAFSARWRLVPIDGGLRTEVDFRLYVDPNMPLPSAVFSRENEKAAGRTVRALRTRVIDTAKRS